MKNNPLSITDEEANTIYSAVKNSALKQIIKRYNGASSVSFTSLTKQQQTVIASVSFQYGTAPPVFWGHVTKQEWTKTAEVLRDFKDDYPSRRKLEANYLEGK